MKYQLFFSGMYNIESEWWLTKKHHVVLVVCGSIINFDSSLV